MLPNLTPRKSGDRTIWYFRRKGQPLVRMPDLPHDHPDFLRAYAEAKGSSTVPAQRPGSLAELCNLVEASPHLTPLSRGYRAGLLRQYKDMAARYGDVKAAAIEAKHVRKDVTGAAAPALRLKAWRMLFRVAMDRGMLAEDPSFTVRAPTRQTEGHPPWTPDEIDAFRARWPIGTTKRAAFEVLHWTGARISDAVLIGPGMVGRDGVLAYSQGKTGGAAYVPWTCALPAYAADMAAERDAMHRALAGTDQAHMTFLATAQGSTRSDKALGTMIREAAIEAGVQKTAHGLRKSRAVFLAEAGATTHQIGSWTGHATLKEIAHYTESMDRRRAVMGTEQDRNGVKSSGQGVNSRKIP